MEEKNNTSSSTSNENNEEQQENILLDAYRAQKKSFNELNLDEFSSAVRALENSIDDARISIAETHSQAIMVLDPEFWFNLKQMEEDMTVLENQMLQMENLYAPFVK